MKKSSTMAPNKKTSSDSSSRHGKVPDDWIKQSIQLPKDLGLEFRKVGGDMGHGGVKVLGTVAASIVLSLDDKKRETLCQYVREKTWDNGNELDKSKVLTLLLMMLGDGDGDGDGDGVPIVTPRWAVDEPKEPE